MLVLVPARVEELVLLVAVDVEEAALETEVLGSDVDACVEIVVDVGWLDAVLGDSVDDNVVVEGGDVEDNTVVGDEVSVEEEVIPGMEEVEGETEDVALVAVVSVVGDVASVVLDPEVLVVAELWVDVDPVDVVEDATAVDVDVVSEVASVEVGCDAIVLGDVSDDPAKGVTDDVSSKGVVELVRELEGITDIDVDSGIGNEAGDVSNGVGDDIADEGRLVVLVVLELGLLCIAEDADVTVDVVCVDVELGEVASTVADDCC